MKRSAASPGERDDPGWRERPRPDPRLGGAETVVESFGNRETPPSGCAARRNLASVSRVDFGHASATSDDGFVPSQSPSSPSWGSRGRTSRRRKWALTGVGRRLRVTDTTPSPPGTGVVSRAVRARRAVPSLGGCLLVTLRVRIRRDTRPARARLGMARKWPRGGRGAFSAVSRTKKKRL